MPPRRGLAVCVSGGGWTEAPPIWLQLRPTEPHLANHFRHPLHALLDAVALVPIEQLQGRISHLSQVSLQYSTIPALSYFRRYAQRHC